MNITAVIMAGGKGEHFWPKSHSNMPKQFFRPAEVEVLLGNPAKAETELGWRREIPFVELVSRMVKNDLKLVSNEVKAASL